MSTLSKLGAVAGGIMGGMSMRQAMEQKKLEEERLRQDMDMRRQEFEARQEDRNVAKQARENNAAFYSKLGSQPFMQAQSPGSEAVMVPTDPNAPDEPTMGVSRAAQTPRADIAKLGMSEVMRQKPVDYEASARQDAKTLNQFKMQAYALQGQDRAQALAALNEKKAELLSQYIHASGKDPMTDPVGFAKEAGKYGAYFGEIPTGAQAMQFSELMRKHQKEGAEDALKLANAGDKAGALKVWNENGEHRFKDIELVPAKSALKTPSYIVYGITQDGKRVEVLPPGMTAFDAMISLQSGVKMAELAMQQADREADNARADKQLAITDRHYRNQDAAAMKQAERIAKSSSPAQVQTAEWLVANKVAKDLTQAWEMVGTSKEKSREAAIQDMAAKMLASGLVTAEKATADATQVVDSIRGPRPASGTASVQDGYAAYLSAYNKAKSAGNTAAMQELTEAARSAGIVK
jgi:hypothetical protein